MKKNGLVHIVKTIPEIELVYQFGSTVHPSHLKPQDVDIGILLKEGVSPERRLDICVHLSDQLSVAFNKKVDVALLNNASPIFIHQVLKKGKLLYGSSKKAHDFLVKTLTSYFEYVQFHRFFTENLKKYLGVRKHG